LIALFHAEKVFLKGTGTDDKYIILITLDKIESTHKVRHLFLKDVRRTR
jgi:hypothetical protein